MKEKISERTIKDCLNGLSDNEMQKIRGMLNYRSDLSMNIFSVQFQHSSVGGFKSEPYISIVGWMNEESKYCFANLGTGSITIGEKLLEEDYIRIILDSKEGQEKFYLHFKGETTEYSNKDNFNENFVFSYVETKHYAQFCLYEGISEKKILVIYMNEEERKPIIRAIAFSFLKRLYPEISTNFFYGGNVSA
ncbi:MULTISPECIES: hypothetical protein [unclassified Paenibacillus]|uniref:hypothetical protein n=1 Tax=unclassified Paenibacillus TaxID=185978 RepID=UPI003836D417